MKSRIFGWLRPSIDGLITERILAFYKNMIAKGQIDEVPAEGPAGLPADPNVATSRSVGLGVVPKQI